MFIWAAVSIVSAIGAGIPAIRKRSWLHFAQGIPKVLMGIILPVAFFYLSAVLMPTYKAEARHGWIDCFPEAKFALFPLVFWALAAFYAVEVWQVANPRRGWIVLGCLHGAIVSNVCFLLGGKHLFTNWFDRTAMLVPGYVAAYYLLRTVNLMRGSNVSALWTGLSFLAAAPFWGRTIDRAHELYAALPVDQPHDCFVVTAATRGHTTIVGTLQPVRRGSLIRYANAQLITLWNFETWWQLYSPATHSWVRRIYNRVGPRAARLIQGRWLADAAYFLLKPVEWFAAAVLSLAAQPPTRTP